MTFFKKYMLFTKNVYFFSFNMVSETVGGISVALQPPNVCLKQ